MLLHAQLSESVQLDEESDVPQRVLRAPGKLFLPRWIVTPLCAGAAELGISPSGILKPFHDKRDLARSVRKERSPYPDSPWPSPCCLGKPSPTPARGQTPG